MITHHLDNSSTFNNSMRQKTQFNTVFHRRKFSPTYHEKHEDRFLETQYYVLDHVAHENQLLHELRKQLSVLKGARYEQSENKGHFILNGYSEHNKFMYGLKTDFLERRRVPSSVKLLEGLCTVGIEQAVEFEKPVYIIPPQRFDRVTMLAFTEDMDLSVLGKCIAPPGYVEIVQSGDGFVRLVGGKYNRNEVKAYLPE